MLVLECKSFRHSSASACPCYSVLIHLPTCSRRKNMNISLIIAKVSFLKFNPDWVDGGPGQPGPIFRGAIKEYAVAELARAISQQLSNKDLGLKLHEAAKELVSVASKQLPISWEDGDD